MTGARNSVNDVDVDLAQLFGAVRRHWSRILVFSLVVAGLAFAWAFTSAPLYRAETRLLIEARESVFTRPSEEGGTASMPLLDQEAISSQVEVISSSDILRDVARRLDLASHDEFGADTSGLRGFLILLGLRSDPGQASVEERVLGIMREKLSVFRVESSRVIVIRFSSRSPELAAAVPNAIAEAYIAVQEQAKLASNNEATNWLEPEIADLRQRVREAEARVAEYRAGADLFTGEGTSSLSGQQLSQLSAELTRVRAERSAIEARAAAIRQALDTGRPVEAMPDILNSPLVQRLRERYAQLSSDRADLSASLLGNHPRIRALDAQIAETEQQLRSEMQKVLRSLETEVATAQASERQLTGDVNGLKSETARAEGDEVELRALEREAAAQRALLESYLTRLREASARAERNYLPADARVFARAVTPFETYFPKTLPITAAAFAGSLLLAAVFTLVSELFSGRAMRPAPGVSFQPEQVVMPAAARQEPVPVAWAEQAEQVETEAGVATPVAAEPEDPPSSAGDVTSEREEISVAEAADQLIVASAVRAVFISPEGDEAGASSVMVARELADIGLRALFLDLTWSGAPSASMLESGRYPGITNLLASEAQFADIIHGDLYSDCHVIPVGTADRERALQAVERLPIILSSLNTAYDLVVIECGDTDASALSRVVGPDTVVMLGVIDSAAAPVRDAAANLQAHGYRDLLKVAPRGGSLPVAPHGRSVA